MVVASSMLLFVVVLLSYSFCGHALPALAELDPELRAVDLQSYDPYTLTQLSPHNLSFCTFVTTPNPST